MMSSPSLVSCPAQMWRTVHQSLPYYCLVIHIEELSEKCLEKTQYDGESGTGLFLKGKFRSHLPLPMKFQREETSQPELLWPLRERESFSYLILGLSLCEAGVSQTTHYFTSTCMFLLMQITSKQSIVRIHGHFIPTKCSPGSIHSASLRGLLWKVGDK